MKKPGKMKPGKAKMERGQGKIAGSGVNMPVKKEKVPQKDMKTTYGAPTQKQKL